MLLNPRILWSRQETVTGTDRCGKRGSGGATAHNRRSSYTDSSIPDGPPATPRLQALSRVLNTQGLASAPKKLTVISEYMRQILGLSFQA